MFETVPLQIRQLINKDVFLTVGSLLHGEGRLHKRCALLVSSALCLLFFFFFLEMIIERSFVSRLPSVKSLSKI